MTISRIVYFHLSERRASYVLERFISEVPLNSHFWPVLKAVAIEDVPRDISETPLSDFSFLFKVQSLSLDIPFHRYDPDEYDDFGIIIQILSYLSKLRSLRFTNCESIAYL